MDYTAYIRELLFSHDCVIIPDFGGFIGNYTPARVDRKTGTFYPPVKQISFNRNLNHNDGLLVGRISGSTGINYGDTRTMVGEYVADLRSKLEKGEKIVFDHIGSFINNQEGNMQFEPDRSVNYHLDSYGLEPFRMFPLEGYNYQARISRSRTKDPEKQAAIRKILWRAAVIAPLLAVLVVIPLRTDLLRSKVESSNLNPLVTAEFEHNRKALDEGTKTEEISKTPELKQSEKAAETEEKIAPVETARPEPVVSQPAPVQSGSFYLITGSFKSQANAEVQVSQLKVKGFSPEIVMTSNGFYRVCAMGCNDQATAELKKDSLAGQFPGVWISRKK